MVLKFENKMNSVLYLEKSSNLSVILGHYDNSKELYDSQLKITPYDYKITPISGSRFSVTTSEGHVDLGKVSGGVQLIVEGNIGRAEYKEGFTINCKILKFKNTPYNIKDLKPGTKIFSSTHLHACEDYEVNDHVFTVADKNDPENIELLNLCKHYPLPDDEILLTTEILYPVENVNLYYTEPINFPEWIYEGAPLLFTRVTGKLDFEHRDEYGDSSPIEIEYKEETVGIVDNVDYNPINCFFTVDIDTKIKLNEPFKIQCNAKQNTNNIIEQNSLGGKINVGLTAINNGNFLRCTDFKCKDGGLLLYDQLHEKKRGSVSGSEKSKRLIGHNTVFLQDFKPDDLILIDGHESNILKIKKIISNVSIELYDDLGFDVEEADIYLTDSIYDSVESIIYDVYDNRDNNSQGNFHNIMPIRGNRKIKFFFGAKEKTLRNVKGNKFEANFDTNVYNMYKLWVNGKLLEKGKQYLIKNGTIEIMETHLIRRYNNYCYFIYYPKVNMENTYAFLSYEGYKTNFPSKQEYLKSLYKFPYYSNFSESPSYNYYEIKDDVLDTSRRILLDKSHTISFSSYITNDAGEINNKNITIDLENITRGTFGFRLIRHNKDTNTFTVYTQCELVNPAAETLNDDANIVSYTINHKDKIILLDRSFGDGDWGRFELFGLKLLGIY